MVLMVAGHTEQFVLQVRRDIEAESSNTYRECHSGLCTVEFEWITDGHIRWHGGAFSRTLDLRSRVQRLYSPFCSNKLFKPMCICQYNFALD